MRGHTRRALLAAGGLGGCSAYGGNRPSATGADDRTVPPGEDGVVRLLTP